MRQHLALSEFAFNVINTDMISYFEADTLSAFISHLLNNYYDSPDVSIFRTYLKEQAEIRSSFEKFDSDFEEKIPSGYDRYFMHKLLLGKVEKLLKEERTYANNVVIKPYIKNDAARRIDEQMAEEAEMFGENSDFAFLGRPKYLKSRAAYIKNILETYARQSPFKREAVIYKSIIAEAEKIEQFYKPDFESNQLKLNLYRIRLRNVNSFGDPEAIEECLAKPYRVTKEHETEHPYLLAYTYKKDSRAGTRQLELDYFPCSDIVSFIECPPSHGSGKLTKEQKIMLENAVTEYGFYGMNTEEVVISFSEEGILQYIAAPSPKPYSDPHKMRAAAGGRKVMVFKGDANQIMRYFSSFGDYAMILSSKDCSDTMKELYSESIQTYNEYTLELNRSDFAPDVMEELHSDIEAVNNAAVWDEMHNKYSALNHSEALIGIYPLFIKLAAENNIAEAYPIYADMLFEGIRIEKDYNLAGYYYGLCKTLSVGQKCNKISIYVNELCKTHSKKEGTDLLTFRNMAEEKYFTYPSPEGHVFYAPEVKVQELFVKM